MRSSSSQSGFSLVEIAMVIMIIGLLIGGSLSMIKPYMQMAQRNLTQKKMENISLALANFAQNYGRLPCPADPSLIETNPLFGSPRNSGSDGLDVAENNCSSRYVGIIPFRAIGLDKKQIYDSYNNLITYAVSEEMAKYNSTNRSGNIHNMCRTAMWQDPANLANNANLTKARLCCPVYTSNDINVYVSKTTTPANNIFAGSEDHKYSAANSGDPDDLIDTPAENPAANNRLIAFVLISHGPNGNGAFIEHINNIHTTSVPANSPDLENINTPTGSNLSFISTIQNNANNNSFFDDILVWKTNDQLVSAFGNDSCAHP